MFEILVPQQNTVSHVSYTTYTAVMQYVIELYTAAMLTC